MFSKQIMLVIYERMASYVTQVNVYADPKNKNVCNVYAY